MGQQDGLPGKGTCYQVGWPMFNPWGPRGGRRELTPTGCSLPPHLGYSPQVQAYPCHIAHSSRLGNSLQVCPLLSPLTKAGSFGSCTSLAGLLGASGCFCLQLPSPYSYMLALMAQCVCLPCIHVLWGGWPWIISLAQQVLLPAESPHRPWRKIDLPFCCHLPAKAVSGRSKGGSTGKMVWQVGACLPQPFWMLPQAATSSSPWPRLLRWAGPRGWEQGTEFWGPYCPVDCMLIPTHSTPAGSQVPQTHA